MRLTFIYHSLLWPKPLFLALIGTAISYGLALVTGVLFSAAVPVSFDLVTMMLYGAILIVVAMAGAVFSVLTTFRIDPLKAIGG